MYGLIGKKLGHSFSADFFNKKFQKENINEEYKLFPLSSIEDLETLIRNNNDLKGLNVTIPYKQEILPFLSFISSEARNIGAVNVVKIERQDKNIILKGYNSDCIGFRDSLLPILNDDIKNALILGTGGASKAVAYVLQNLGIKVTFVSRNPKNGEISYNQLDKKIIEKNKLIVNTTPLGMFPDVETYPPLPYHFLTREHLCYDLVYNPLETEFMKKSKKEGAKIKNGLDMLIGQAIAAWEIWNE